MTRTIRTGLHVTMDFATGKRRAKLMGKDTPATASNQHAQIPHDLAVVPSGADVSEPDQQTPSTVTSRANQVRTHEPAASRGPTPAHATHKQDPLQVYIDTLTSARVEDTAHIAHLSDTLSELEELVHDVGRGADFAAGTGLRATQRLLDVSWPSAVRAKAAMVLGAALSVSTVEPHLCIAPTS